MNIEAQLRSDGRIERLMKNPNWSGAAEAAIRFLVTGTVCPISSWRKSSTWAQVDMVYKELREQEVGKVDDKVSTPSERVPANISYPMKLAVGVEQARKRIERIPHNTCRVGARRHWKPTDEGNVSEQAVNWLFCWGKTGMRSEAAAAEARRVFDEILPVTFSHYDEVVGYERAERRRYS